MHSEETMGDGMGRWECIVPFVSEDPNFCLGWEAGQLYARLRHGTEDRIEQSIHAANDEQVHLMANRLGWDCEITPPQRGADDPWAFATLTKR